LLFVTVILPVGGSFLITNARFSEREFPDPPEGAEAVSFATTDGVDLGGWWIPAAGERGVIVLVHGLSRSREEMADRAAAIREDGFSTLLVDLRNHGSSADAYTTLGVYESRDVQRAAEYARSRRPEGPLVIWGVSMGAAASLLAARSAAPDAVIAESAFDSFENTVAHHLRQAFGLPAFRMGFAVSDGDVEAAVAALGELPILFVAGEEDWRMPPAIAVRLLEASASPLSRLHVVAGAGHGRAWQTDPAGYLAAVRAFLAGMAPPASTLY
jgi:alpha-beta hydrolase superfamily lysophospholipase